VWLLLRAHAELGWLGREVLPVVLQIENPALLSPEQRHAARAYLEVAWAEAELRAQRTDAVHARLVGTHESPALSQAARRYHDGVRSLRARMAARISVLLTPAGPPR
jgi:hypothetical protein